MSKGRGGPSLFEVIGKTASTLPPGSQIRRPAPADSVADDDSAALGQYPTSSEQTAASPADSVEPVRPSGPVPSPSVFAIDGPRLVITLSSVMTGLFVFVLVVAVGAAYYIGQSRGLKKGQEQGYQAARRTIEQQALDDIAKARNAHPDPNVFADLPTNPVEPNRAAALTGQVDPPGTPSDTQPASTPATGQPTTWIKGQTYIVVQEFLDTDLDQAHRAQQFLAQNGVATTLFTASGQSKYRYRLVTQKGFNTDDPVQKKLCNRFHEKIRKLGKRFVEAGGRYDLQGYQKKAVASP